MYLEAEKLVSASQLLAMLPTLAVVVENGNARTLRASLASYREDVGFEFLEAVSEDYEILSTDGLDLISQEFNEIIDTSMEGATIYRIVEFDQKLVLVSSSPIGSRDDPIGVLIAGMNLSHEYLDGLSHATGVHLTVMKKYYRIFIEPARDRASS